MADINITPPERGTPHWDVPINAALEALEAGVNSRLDRAENLADVLDADAARTNIGAVSQADTDALYASSAQGAKADSAVQPGTLAPVATSGVYSDLSGLPTLGTASALDVADIDTATASAITNALVDYSTTAELAAGADATVAAQVESGPLTGAALDAAYAPLAGSTETTSTLPVGLGWDQANYPVTPSITVSASGDSKGSIGVTAAEFFDIFSTARSAPAATYYVSTTGSDASNGLTAGTAFRSIGKAIVSGNAAGVPTLVKIAGGDYERAYAFDATAGYYPQVDMAFVNTSLTGVRVVAGVWDAATGFAVDGTHANTYSKVVANCTRVLDLTRKNRFGNFTELTPVTSAARANITPDSWYCDGTKLYINRGDGAAVTNTNTRYFRDAPNLRVQSQVNVFLDGIDLQGSGSSYSVFHVNSATVTTPIDAYALVANNSTFRYGGAAGAVAGRGFAAVNWYGIMAAFGCSADANANDGFGLHNPQSGPAYLLTVNCNARDNGRGNQSVNAFTVHEACRGIDIAGVFEESRGGAVHNIADSLCYLLGTTVINDLGDSGAGGGIPPVAFRAAQNAVIWAERTRAIMPSGTFAYQAVDIPSVVHTRNIAPVRQPNSGAGTIDTY